MRIISGTHKGKRLHPPKNLPVRPTTDFAKESLFNVLNNRVDFEAVKVLDLFAGTGSISLEFASRQATEITAVDQNYRCIDFIKRSAKELKLDQIKAIKANVFKILAPGKNKYDIIFADPPYDLEEIPEIPDLIFENNLLNDGGMFILEHSRKNTFENHPHFEEHRKYGNVNFSFFK